MQELVRAECERWAGKGVDVRYEARGGGRRGYKAGALREGMGRAYARGCDLVAVFDADFQPDPDFLRRAVPCRSSSTTPTSRSSRQGGSSVSTRRVCVCRCCWAGLSRVQ